MREFYEFRVLEEYANRLFRDDEGDRLGGVRRVVVSADDERLPRVGELQKELRRSLNTPFFFGWSIRRYYTDAELLSAEFLHLQFERVFEPAGEQCGTEYNEATACVECGAGATQVGPLRLDTRSLSERLAVATTIADEVVVSRGLAELLRTSGVRGAQLKAIERPRKSGFDGKWCQLVITNTSNDIVSPTRIASDPFDDSERPEERCSRGDLLGLNLLTELFVTISDTSINPQDYHILATKQFVGVRRGLLRPRRFVLISNATWRLMTAHRIKGVRVEIAHRVQQGTAIHGNRNSVRV